MDRYTIMMGTCESQGKIEKIFTISPDLFFEERDKLKAEIKNPNATDESVEKIATNIVNAKVSQKLGEYEDIDESPEHLAKIKRALDIIKKKKVNVKEMLYWFGLKSERYEFTYQEYCRVYNDYEDDYDVTLLSEELLTEEEFNLLKEVLL